MTTTRELRRRLGADRSLPRYEPCCRARASSHRPAPAGFTRSSTTAFASWRGDLIERDGEDLRRAPLEDRKHALADLLRGTDDGNVRTG